MNSILKSQISMVADSLFIFLFPGSKRISAPARIETEGVNFLIIVAILV